MNTKKIMQSRTRRGQLMIMVLTGVIAMWNGSMAWAGFFDACESGEEARIEVTQNTIVKDETATLPGSDSHRCKIKVENGVTLEFKNVHVNVTGDTQLSFDGDDNSRLIIGHSTLKMCDLYAFGFDLMRIVHSELKLPVESSCPVAEMFIDSIGDLKIISSSLRADGGITLVPDNSVTIKKSSLNATTPLGFGLIYIGTGGFGSGFISQHTRVEKTDISAGQALHIWAEQDTTVIKNEFQIGNEGFISLYGHPCTSKSNTPDVPCE